MPVSRTQHWVSRSMVSLLLLLATAQAADEADALPSLFDFLGAMVEQEGEWVDPLDMEQDFAAQDSALTDIDTVDKSAAVAKEQQEKTYETQ